MRYLNKLNKRVWLIILLLVLDGLFFSLTNPNNLNSVFLIVGFVFLGITFFLCLQALFELLNAAGFKTKNKNKLAIYFSVILTIFIVLQSLGQLTAKDILVIIPIAVIIYVYTAKIRA